MKLGKLVSGHPLVGKRVEIHPGSDAWAQGARFGTVQSVRHGTVRPDVILAYVRMDHKGIKRLLRFMPNDLQVLS